MARLTWEFTQQLERSGLLEKFKSALAQCEQQQQQQQQPPMARIDVILFVSASEVVARLFLVCLALSAARPP
ncbi:hypothetical protein OEZ86_011294 [Tetradesmus obliquus]|nr:hypothetical protein OEZ86_011294 [Tetradesmus obliquus]